MTTRDDIEPSHSVIAWEQGKTIAAAVEELAPLLRSEYLDEDDRIVLQNCVNELTGLAQCLSDQSAIEAAGDDWNR